MACLALLFGCLGGAQPASCGTNNECLEKAFIQCQNYSGVWEGQNGNMSVKILGQKDETCRISVIILGDALNISQKSMTCDVPLAENASFAINESCSGELKKYLE
ncbi:hypothetical protein H0O00_05745 [Candidatus Micrarchaeota archaeon]|nr:hypothetical protein [Candidatus Micrarchaeota archaeon]